MSNPDATPLYGTLVEHMAFDGLKRPDRRAAVEKALGGDIGLTPLGRAPGDADVVLGFQRFVKTTPTYATQMVGPFTVNTPEGVHEGKAGDWLAIGIHGEMYPIDASVMAASYQRQTDAKGQTLRVPDPATVNANAPLGFQTPAAPLEGQDQITETQAPPDAEVGPIRMRVMSKVKD